MEGKTFRKVLRREWTTPRERSTSHILLLVITYQPWNIKSEIGAHNDGGQ